MFLRDPRISNIVFYPRKANIPSNLPDNIKVLKFSINDNITIGGMFYIKNKESPSILMFHGNGEIALDYLYFYKEYLDSNVNLAVMDFRGYGFSNGNPDYITLIEDSLPIYNKFVAYIKNRGYKNEIFLFGRSLGSVCISEIAKTNPSELKGIIFESGFANLYNIMTYLFNVKGSDITPETLEPYSNHIRIKKINKPALILHGTHDMIIPKEEADLIFDALPDNINKTKVFIQGAGHNDIMSHKQEYFTSLRNFIQSYQSSE